MHFSLIRKIHSRNCKTGWWGCGMSLLKKITYSILCIIAVVIAWSSYQYASITQIGNETTPEKADVLIVLGAAVWENGPSPSLLARINLAQQLYMKQLASDIILSGGQGKHGPTEAEAMATVLKEYIQPQFLHLDDQSTTTFENIKNSKRIMDDYGYTSAIIVTDTFHLKRALKMAKDAGIIAYGAPTKESILNKNKSLKMYYTIREVMAITKYYILHR